jgi:hypothetical protein
MVTGRDLIEHGWPEGPTIGLALAAARKLRAAGIIHWSAWNRNSRKSTCRILDIPGPMPMIPTGHGRAPHRVAFRTGLCAFSYPVSCLYGQRDQAD